MVKKIEVLTFEHSVESLSTFLPNKLPAMNKPAAWLRACSVLDQ